MEFGSKKAYLSKRKLSLVKKKQIAPALLPPVPEAIHLEESKDVGDKGYGSDVSISDEVKSRLFVYL
jgi:hypothetical protein